MSIPEKLTKPIKVGRKDSRTEELLRIPYGKANSNYIEERVENRINAVWRT